MRDSLVAVGVGKRDHLCLQMCSLKRARYPVISFWLAMKRLGGIVCCLFLLLASAAWALERCQSFDAHPSGHEHSAEVSPSHIDHVDLLRDLSSPEDPTIHCANSREILSFVSQSPARLARSIVAYRILPSSFAPVMAAADGWVKYSEKRPPGSFFSAVSPYLSLSVLRF